MADAVAASDLNHRGPRAASLTLTPGLVVDAAGADGSGLAVLAVFPQVRAEVVHQRIIGRGSSRIKSGSTSVPFEGPNTWGGAGSGSARTQTTTSCSSDFN